MTTPHHENADRQTPDEFAQLGNDQELDTALKPKKTVNLPAATAVLAGIVVLAIGLAGGAGLHAAFASDSPTTTPQAGRGAGGYGGFRGQGQGQGQGQPGGGQGSAAIGTVVSANQSQLVVKTQNGDVTVKLTGDTSIEITDKGTAADLKTGQQVIVSGETTDGSLTARTVRQGNLPTGGFNRNPSATPSTR
ncbi:DUF5666 domain-containing protein [Kribbella sp. VKM Ac-2568]|uniref:DUF5666 domain-containing protein n=1 Tax=Kribbella sp. VKM Ac-2568 TaxID=2512219 RepID=UPI001048458E|nr:DUF5666 domain-containing protein [Kribbella sp. VKM Ac-2568]TCM40330.1 hypothetical protein EV648_113153 [Kribbella sp. VKM Ac-2568]